MANAPIYPNARVLMNVGEGIHALDDLNLMQALRESSLWDMFAGGLMVTDESNGGPQSRSNLALGLLRSLWALGAAPIASATALTIDCEDGTLMFYDSASRFEGAGGFYSGAGVLAYHVRSSALKTTFAAAHPTLDRIDLVCLRFDRIENDSADNETRTFKAAVGVDPVAATFTKRSKLAVTLSVVQGTPGASPSTPAAPNNMAPWAAVRIRAANAGVIDVQDIYDHRWPLGFDRLTQRFLGNSGAALSGSVIPGNWALDASSVFKSANNGDVAIVLPPTMRALHNARLSSISIAGLLSGSTVQLIAYNMEPTAAANTFAVLADLSSAFNGGGDQPYTWNPASGIAGSLVDPPYWGNGEKAGIACYRNPKANPHDARVQSIGLAITAGAAGKILKQIVWDFATQK
jgi:hypothetical protein